MRGVCACARVARGLVCVHACLSVCTHARVLGSKGREETGGTQLLSLPLISEVCIAFFSASIFLSPSSSSCVCVFSALVGFDCLVCRQIATTEETRRKAQEVVTLGRGVGLSGE